VRRVSTGPACYTSTISDCMCPDAFLISRPAGDITGDCFVNFEDYAALASQWLQSPGSPSADIAPDPPDAFVNILDLAVLADGWLEGILLL